jgi:hypothetical protein
MTQAEVRALSDEELNAACAEKVMGWIKGKLWKGRETWYHSTINSLSLVEFWQPATDLADALYCGLFAGIKQEDEYPSPRARAEAALLAAIKDSATKV